MESGLRDRNNAGWRDHCPEPVCVSMKSGLGDRNNGKDKTPGHHKQIGVSIKSGLGDRNNVETNEPK